MNEPFFSIVIPTKNRPDRLTNTIRSVLAQRFTDFEIVACDNSDQAESVETAQAVQDLDDPRIRYVRTSGQLSMPDNWERAVAEASGQFVGILTDRSVFRRDALQVISTEIEQTGVKCVSWFNDLYGRDPSGKEYKRRASTRRRHRLHRDTVLDYFVHGDPKYAPKIIPKLMTCVCHRSILDAVRSTFGRCCPPVAPDFTSGFLILAYCDSITKIDEALYTSSGVGNGMDFRRRSGLADRFRQDLGMTWEQMVDRMPSEACFAHALVLNDLMRVRDMIPERFPGLEIDRVQYYLGCLNDYAKTAKRGVRRTEDLDILIAALEREPEEVQRQVQDTRLYVGALSIEPRAEPEEKAPAGTLMFDSVFDALAWDEANPREPIERSFLDILPSVAEMKRAPATDRIARRLAKKAAATATEPPEEERRETHAVAAPGAVAMMRLARASLRSRRVANRLRSRIRLRTRLRTRIRRA